VKTTSRRLRKVENEQETCSYESSSYRRFGSWNRYKMAHHLRRSPGRDLLEGRRNDSTTFHSFFNGLLLIHIWRWTLGFLAMVRAEFSGVLCLLRWRWLRCTWSLLHGREGRKERMTHGLGLHSEPKGKGEQFRPSSLVLSPLLFNVSLNHARPCVFTLNS
jgi:hypothetical protein